MGQNIWKDGVFGLIVGDALGVPVEFSSREECEHNPVIGMRASITEATLTTIKSWGIFPDYLI